MQVECDHAIIQAEPYQKRNSQQLQHRRLPSMRPSANASHVLQALLGWCLVTVDFTWVEATRVPPSTPPSNTGSSPTAALQDSSLHQLHPVVIKIESTAVVVPEAVQGTPQEHNNVVSPLQGRLSAAPTIYTLLSGSSGRDLAAMDAVAVSHDFEEQRNQTRTEALTEGALIAHTYKPKQLIGDCTIPTYALPGDVTTHV